MKPLSPFFKYFGSKKTSTLRGMYDAPKHDTIIEPFAGGAGYSLVYWEKRVKLFDADERVCAIWDYLIRVKPSEILALPLLKSGERIEALGLCQEVGWFIGAWLNAGNFRAKTACGWVDDCPSAFWSDRTRERIARQVELIRHWTISRCDYSDIQDESATWFIDPPYESLASCYAASKAHPIDFAALGSWCMSRTGQVIVCEKEGASWLPFRYCGQGRATRSVERSKRASEAIWTNYDPRQINLFGDP